MDAIGVLNTNPLDDYELIHRIGSGTYGDVFKVHTETAFSNCQLYTVLVFTRMAGLFGMSSAVLSLMYCTVCEHVRPR